MRRNFLLLRGLLLALSLWSTIPASAARISRDDPESSDPNSRGISTAIDALVTAQAVLTVVEPQRSGLAGGGFLLHWDSKQRQLSVLDGREVAPERSRPGDLLDAAGDPLP